MPAVHDVPHYVRDDPIDLISESERLRVSQRKPWRRWLVSVLILAICIVIGWSLLVNENLRWSVVLDYLFARPILEGLLVTIELSVIAMAIGIVLGVLLAVAGRSQLSALRWVASGYIWLFRGVPLLVQLLFWFNVGVLVPGLTLWLPMSDLSVYVSANAMISGFTASILGLGLNEGAYMAEIVRAGLISVPKGQSDAALSLGMPRGKAMRSIVLPQTVRVVIPPAGNQFIGLFKSSAMVAVIGGGDLLYRAQIIYGQNFEVIPLLLVVSIWYLVITSAAMFAQSRIEDRLSDDANRLGDEARQQLRRVRSRGAR